MKLPNKSFEILVFENSQQNLVRFNPVFLDRDGVLNHVVGPYPGRAPWYLSEWNPILEFKKITEHIRDCGRSIIVVTNQPDISRGNIDVKALNEISSMVFEAFPEISLQLICPHSNELNCECKKPKTGLLEFAEKKFNLNLKNSIMVGDRWTDVLMAKSSGIFSILWRKPYSMLPTSNGLRAAPDCNADFETLDLNKIYAKFRELM